MVQKWAEMLIHSLHLWARQFCICYWGDSCARDSKMGDWPRWIDLPNVDSQAMYSAFLAYDCRMQSHEEIRAGGYRPVWSGHLMMIIHRVAEEGVVPAFRVNGTGNVKETPCQQMGCKRCEEGKGGYQFK